MRLVRMLLLVLTMSAAQLLPAQYRYGTPMKALDFEGVTVDGRDYCLQESQSEHIILCFWSVDCEYCHDFLKKLRRRVDLKNDYELVTFALAECADDVQKEVKKLRLPGWHFYDPSGWDSDPFMDYDVNITPTIVLIDKDKNRIGEAYDWEEFRELIKK